MKITKEVEEAFLLAKKAQLNSYSPYSKFPVGSAVKFNGNEKIFYGTNVENLSYGATLCAERSAISNAVASFGKKSIEFVIVVAPSDDLVSPCGICLQVIDEFRSKNTKIFLATKEEIKASYLLEDFLANPFRTDLLGKD